MKRDTLEKWMLLEQSGELDVVRGWLLRRALRGDAQAQRYRDDLQKLTSASRDAREEGSVSRMTLAAIMQAARKEENFAPSPALYAWRPVMAAAAVAMMLGAGWLTLRRPDSAESVATTLPSSAPTETELPWSDGLDEEIDALSTMITQTADEWDSNENATDLESMAKQLMQWEETNI